MHKLFISVIILISMVGCSLAPSRNDTQENNTPPSTNTSNTPVETPTVQPIKEEPKTTDKYKIEVVAHNLFIPWSIVFTSKDRILFTERNGNLRVIENGVLNPTSLKVFSEVSTISEEGLMGLALDPNYNENKFIYLSLAYGKGQEIVVKVIRYKDGGNVLTDEKILIDKIPAAKYHSGSRIKFGPDGKLYITTGDALLKNDAQNKSKLNGKILRINSDGSNPSDNPFPNSPIYSYGHRNSQGIDWYPGSVDTLYSTEHGPSGFDGPKGGDEINIIKKGANYGWPLVSHKQTRSGIESPQLVFTPAIAPSAGMFYKSGVIKPFKNNFFFSALVGKGIYRAIIDENDYNKIVKYEKMSDINFGRIREIAEGPDGSIYFSTSNRDERGVPSKEDDRIYRIIPDFS